MQQLRDMRCLLGEWIFRVVCADSDQHDQAIAIAGCRRNTQWLEHHEAAGRQAHAAAQQVAEDSAGSLGLGQIGYGPGLIGRRGFSDRRRSATSRVPSPAK